MLCVHHGEMLVAVVAAVARAAYVELPIKLPKLVGKVGHIIAHSFVARVKIDRGLIRGGVLVEAAAVLVRLLERKRDGPRCLAIAGGTSLLLRMYNFRVQEVVLNFAMRSV